MSKPERGDMNEEDSKVPDGVSVSRRVVVGAAAAVAATAVAGIALETNARAQDVEHSDLTQDPVTPEALGAALPDDIAAAAADWPTYQQSYSSHRAAVNSSINAGNVASLEIAWAFVKDEALGYYGPASSPALVLGDRLYFQDGSSNVYALDARTGELVWKTAMDTPTPGPSGIAVAYGQVFAHTARDLFALSASTGELIWQRTLIVADREYLGGTPTVYNSTIYLGKSPGDYGPGYQGGLFAINANTGGVMWEFDTTNGLWGAPGRNSGGGIWYPASIDEDGNIYFGVGNAGPVPGNGGENRPSDTDDRYASSMVSLDATTGSVRWYYQDAPHNFFDHDFQASPILAEVDIEGINRKLAIGAGKTGNVVAVDRVSGEVIWKTPVGEHNEFGDGRTPIPDGEVVTVLPGASAGGIQTSIAYNEGTVFAPANNCASGFSLTSWATTTSLEDSTGQLAAIDAATGIVKWQVELSSMPTGSATVANDVVFTGTLDGLFRAYHAETGALLWSHQFASGIFTPPVIVGDTVYAIASGPLVEPSAIAAGVATPAAAPVASPAAVTPLANALVAFRIPS